MRADALPHRERRLSNPLLLAARAITTIMTGVFFMNWVFAPGELTLDTAREWDVAAHSFIERAGRTSLLLRAASGHQVKVGCAYYPTLCAHVESAGTGQLRVWTDELGYFTSTSLIQARAGERDIVSLRSQQEAYEARSLSRNAPLLIFFALAVIAWRWPRLMRRLRSGNTAEAAKGPARITDNPREP